MTKPLQSRGLGVNIFVDINLSSGQIIWQATLSHARAQGAVSFFVYWLFPVPSFKTFSCLTTDRLFTLQHIFIIRALTKIPWNSLTTIVLSIDCLDKKDQYT